MVCVWQGLLRREGDLENLAHTMVLQAATGLAALHTRGIMHRDLKVQHDLTQTAMPYCLPPPPCQRGVISYSLLLLPLEKYAEYLDAVALPCHGRSTTFFTSLIRSRATSSSRLVTSACRVRRTTSCAAGQSCRNHHDTCSITSLA